MRFTADFAEKMIETWHHQPASTLVEMNFAGRDLPRLGRRLAEDGNPTAAIDALLKLMGDACEGVYTVPGPYLIEQLRAARYSGGDPLSEHRLGDSERLGIVQWPTSVARLNQRTGGGFALTCFAGEPKVGKSLLAIGSAITACDAGWRTVYVNAELTSDEIDDRAWKFCAGNVPPNVVENFLALNTSLDCTLDMVHEKAEQHIECETDRLLIVVDSVNRLAELSASANSGSETGYWQALREIQGYAMHATRISKGQISFLVVSELNAKGTVRGRMLEYASNMLVRCVSETEPSCVSLDVQYSRSTPSGDLGVFRRDWETAHFDYLGREFDG